MEDKGLIPCPRCGQIIGYNSYFKTYYCQYCGYFIEESIVEQEKIENIKRYYILPEEIKEIFEKVRS